MPNHAKTAKQCIIWSAPHPSCRMLLRRYLASARLRAFFFSSLKPPAEGKTTHQQCLHCRGAAIRVANQGTACRPSGEKSEKKVDVNSSTDGTLRWHIAVEKIRNIMLHHLSGNRLAPRRLTYVGPLLIQQRQPQPKDGEKRPRVDRALRFAVRVLRPLKVHVHRQVVTSCWQGCSPAGEPTGRHCVGTTAAAACTAGGA